jgi:hypothetical protein
VIVLGRGGNLGPKVLWWHDNHPSCKQWEMAISSDIF